ncbi:sensor histidine kinase [Vibrio sp. HN007]|uniref:sensor histidine kinase n=1 Tax=Vibrio iocasae TaxID=3098914 RepID=UPI0035D3FFB7
MSIIKNYGSLFTRVYISIIAGLVLTATIFAFLGSQFFFTSEAERFLQDARFFTEKHLSHVNSVSEGIDANLYKELLEKKSVSFYIFDFELIPKWNGQSPCPDCEFISLTDNVPVYVKERGLYVAIFDLEDTEYSLVFSENRDFFVPEVEWYKDTEIIFTLSLLFAMGIALALTIYLPIRRLDGYLRKLLVTYRSFGNGDISIRANEQVPRPISTLAISFNEMANEIEDKIKQTQIFAQAISHEIRTPLSRIQLTCDLARRSLPESKQPIFNDIDDYIEEINQLTVNIVTVAKLAPTESNRSSLKLIHIELVEFVQSRLRVHSPDKGKMIVSSQTPVFIDTEQTLAQLVLDNILKNAEKYTKSGVWVHIDRQKEHTLVSVHDDGSGIPEDKRREIFLAFSRLDKSRNTQSGGFGLGLTITMSAAKILGWKIRVDDSQYGGAMFTLTIPSCSSSSSVPPVSEESI